jgi:hypothetical protein
MVEKGKEAFEGLVGDVDSIVLLLEFVDFKQTAVEIRDIAQQFFQVGGPLVRLLREALVKQPKQKIAVES